jgi:hypothetical protein
MFQAETTARASAAGNRSTTAVNGTWQQRRTPFLMPRGSGNTNGSGSNDENNGPETSGASSDPSTLYPVLTAVLLVCRFGWVELIVVCIAYGYRKERRKKD